MTIVMMDASMMNACVCACAHMSATEYRCYHRCVCGGGGGSEFKEWDLDFIEASIILFLANFAIIFLLFKRVLEGAVEGRLGLFEWYRLHTPNQKTHRNTRVHTHKHTFVL